MAVLKLADKNMAGFLKNSNISRHEHVSHSGSDTFLARSDNLAAIFVLAKVWGGEEQPEGGGSKMQLENSGTNFDSFA